VLVPNLITNLCIASFKVKILRLNIDAGKMRKGKYYPNWGGNKQGTESEGMKENNCTNISSTTT
jgi:hypothetical protein